MNPIVYGGNTYAPKPLTVDAAEAMFEENKGNGRGLNRAVVAGTFAIDPESVGALDFALYQQLLDAALDVHGLRPKGEVTATMSGGG